MPSTESGSTTRWLEIEALKEAVRWPNASPNAIVALASQLMAAREDDDGYVYFSERAQARPDQVLFGALAGVFQARLARRQPPEQALHSVQQAVARLDHAVSQAPGLTTYFRGLVLAELPAALGRAEAALVDLEWVRANQDRFPAGIRRNLHRSRAIAYRALGRQQEAEQALKQSGYPSLDGDGPLFTGGSWQTLRDGFRFQPARLVEHAPGVYVAQSFDFGDFAFIQTRDGIVAIDAGTTDSNVLAALRALREVTSEPITHVILTHAHWDHIGGLDALKGPDTQVIAQANFPAELEIVNTTFAPVSEFFGTEAGRSYDVAPDRLVSARETLTIGGVEFVLYPVRGGETVDALLIHLPATGLLFTGDVTMPYLGAPFLPEGSAEGLFEALDLIESLAPRRLVHGHTPMTENFPIEMVPGFNAALREVHRRVLDSIREGDTLVEILHRNHLPEPLRSHPAAVVPFLMMRDNFIKRVHHQRTGYWKPDGEGIVNLSAREWARALALLSGGREQAFLDSASTLLASSEHALALQLIELGLLEFPDSEKLVDVRSRALDRLRERNQQLNPFAFIRYSARQGAELPPIE